MKKKSVKLIIGQLEKILGGKDNVSTELAISIRQVYYYAKGKKAPIHIYYAIKYLLNVPEHSLTLGGKK